MDHLPDSIFFKDCQSRFTLINASQAAVMGATTEEVIGKTDFDFFPREFAEETFQDEQRLLATGVPLIGKVECVNLPDGRRRWFSATKVPIRQSDGSITGLVGSSREITNLVATEMALRESQKQLQTIITGTPVTVWSVDTEGRYQFIDGQGLKKRGLRPADMVGTSLLDAYHDRPDLIQRFRDALAGTMTSSVDVVDGEIYQSYYSRTFNDEGALTGVIGVSTDITGYVRATEALRSAEEKYRTIVEHINEVIFMQDMNGIMTYASPLVEKMSGYKVEDIVGKLFTTFVHPDDLPGLLESRRKTMEGIIEPAEFRVIEKDGTERHVRTSSRVIVQHGVPTGMIGVMMDITEKKRAEDALRHSERRFRSLVQNNSDTITIVNSKGIVLFQSPSIERILGYTDKELLGRSGFEFFHPEDLPEVSKEFERVLATPNGIARVTLRFQHKDGSWRDLESTLSNLLDDPSIGGIVINTRDLTEKREAERLQASLYEIAQAADNSTTVDELFHAVHASITKVMPASNFFIALYDDKDDTFAFPYFVDEVDSPPDPIAAGKSLTAYVLRTGKSLLCDQAKSDELERNGEALLVGAPAPIWLGVPLIVDDHVIGAMVVQHYTDPKVYTVREQRMLEFVSSEVARVISRKGTEQKLRDSEERYRRLVEYSPDAIAVHTDGIITYANSAAVRLLRAHHARQLVGLPIADIIHPDFRPLVLNKIHELIVQGKEVPMVEEKFLRFDGTSVDVEVSAIPFTYGDRPSVQFVVRDITDRKSAEKAIRESEVKFRSLAETAAAAIFIYQGEKFKYVNSATEAITGYSRSELTMMNFWDIVHPDYRELVKQRGLARQRGENIANRYEFVIVTKGGAQKWLDFTSTVIDYEGSPAGLGTAYDITELMKAQDAVLASEAKYRTLFQQSQDAVFISTPEGKLLDINPAGVELFGYSSPEELLRVDIPRDLYAEAADREKIKRSLVMYGSVRDVEVNIRRRDGTTRLCLLTATVVRQEDTGRTAYQGFIRDITEQRLLEDQLRQAHRLESIGTLAGGIAHDFNNILGIILGYVNVLDSSRTNPPRFAQGVDVVKKAVQRGAGLVNQLLTFARKTDVTLESVNVNEVIIEFKKLVEETFPKTIVFTLELHDPIPTIIADHNQVHQALLNLCVNARDAMPKGGIVNISTSVVTKSSLEDRFTEAGDDTYVRISVADNGAGIDEHTRERIFEPFFTTKERGKGTGLGLAVVYGVVKSHRGFIDVESEVGSGTMFNMYFPIRTQSVEPFETIKSIESEVVGGNETILLVEDEEMILDLVKGLLENRGYRILTARDGVEAVEVYRQYSDEIALVMSDMGLPKLGGFEAFLEMKKAERKPKVIFASGYLDPQTKSEMFKAGVKNFVQKPYDPGEILRSIRDVLDSI